MQNDDWIHTEILGDEDKKKSPKKTILSGFMIGMIAVAAIMLLIAFRGLFMSGGKMENTTPSTATTPTTVKADDTKKTDTTATDDSTKPTDAATKEVTYTVKAGDTLGGIGSTFNVDYKEIAAANNLVVPYDLKVGQKLVIPGASAADVKTDTSDKTTTDTSDTTTTKDTTTATGSTYTVVAGDTLASIADKFGVDYKAIGIANNMVAPYPIEIGQKLIIPDKASN